MTDITEIGILEFETMSANLNVSEGNDTSTGTFITFILKSSPLQQLVRTDGSDLGDMEWSLQVQAAEKYNDHVAKRGGIGLMHTRNPGECSISVAVGNDTFNHLCRSAASGAKIAVHGKGLLVGSNSDAKRISWPDGENIIIVSEIAITLPLQSVAVSGAKNTGRLLSHAAAAADTKLLYFIAVIATLVFFKLYFF